MATINMFHHTKDILVKNLPQILQYRIPLYLPSERIIFQATELIINVPHNKNLDTIYFEDLKIPHKALECEIQTKKFSDQLR